MSCITTAIYSHGGHLSETQFTIALHDLMLEPDRLNREILHVDDPIRLIADDPSGNRECEI